MFQQLIEWSQKEHSTLPWRTDRTLYGTLVSEIMLQQTTVGTVKNHFERFLKVFPNLKSLASASEEELLIAWKGLGYYRRARNLKKIAVAIVKDHKGKIPSRNDELQMIPGIGPYTANALISIGMDLPALAVDANLERVLARFYGFKEVKGMKLQKEIQRLFFEQKIFPDRNISFRALNEALMDLGRIYCQARRATCELCPLKKDCMAYQEGTPLAYPFMAEEKKTKNQEHELHLLRIYVVKKNKVLVYKKEASEWLAGQYEVPTFIIETTDSSLQQYPKLRRKIKHEALISFKTGITKYKIKNTLLVGDEKSLKKLFLDRPLEWRDIHSDQSNFSTATLKGFLKLGQ